MIKKSRCFGNVKNFKDNTNLKRKIMKTYKTGWHVEVRHHLKEKFKKEKPCHEQHIYYSTHSHII
jgi:hypothetical protein